MGIYVIFILIGRTYMGMHVCTPQFSFIIHIYQLAAFSQNGTAHLYFGTKAVKAKETVTTPLTNATRQALKKVLILVLEQKIFKSFHLR